MLGSKWLHLVLTVPNVFILPCTLKVLGLQNLIQDLTCDARFCSSKYLRIDSDSGIPLTLARTSSLTMMFPFSVLRVGFHPFSIRRSAICLRDAGLKGFSLVLVLSCIISGGNIS